MPVAAETITCKACGQPLERVFHVSPLDPSGGIDADILDPSTDLVGNAYHGWCCPAEIHTTGGLCKLFRQD